VVVLSIIIVGLKLKKNGLGGKDVRGWHDKIPKTKVISLRRT
jgi:hypothetical protein